ncbi:DNA breaking-rejoining enzyme [Suillus hirtellus]|nr:DNA breaking-rejoining enzyme [Suillus hirtellus]
MNANGMTNSHFNAPLPIEPTTKLQPYKAGLVPKNSPLHPHCSARDRLKCWVPVQTRSSRDTNGRILKRVLMVINQSWAQGMRECYRAGLLVYHVFCDVHAIPEEQHCPANMLTILNFVSGCAGSYSRKTLANYVYAVHWRVQPDQLKGALDGAINFAPPTSKKLKCEPFTTKLILEIRTLLRLSSPLDAAIFACLTCAFYSLCRIGELTVTAMNTFQTMIHITRLNVQMDTEDRNGLRITKIHLPHTKTAPITNDQTDPKAALLNHFTVNNPSSTNHLFAWVHPRYGLRPLSQTVFLKRIREVAKRIGADNLKGHGLRIGGTLEYLLRGVPFNVVKSMGRWSSDAFTIYLCQHAMIMAPYLQESPILELFTWYTMPPPR